MATPVLNAELRKVTGKSETIKARKAGKVPAVVYSRGVDTKEILFDGREAMRMLTKFGQNARISLNLEGEKSYVIIKDLQRDVVNKQLLHIDFQTLDENEKIRMTMPIQLINREDVETSSKFVELTINEIEIQTYPRYLPDRVELDAAKLKEQEALTIADLNIGEDENIEITEEKDRVIAILTEPEEFEELDGEEGLAEAVEDTEAEDTGEENKSEE